MKIFVPLVRRMKLLALVCTGVVIVSHLGASVAAFADEASYAATARQALIILKSTDISDMHKTIAALKEAGIRPMHVIPPRVVIADVPAGVERSALAISNVASVHRSAVTAIAADKGADLATGTAAWNYLVSPELAAPLQIPPKARPLVGDAFERPTPEVPRLLGGPEAQGAAPGYDSTSEFMIGSVAVGVILPESNEMSPNTENWSNIDPMHPEEPNRKQMVFNKIVTGLNWWATNAESNNISLTFYYDQRFSVPTQYEPIAINDEYAWVSDVFQNMGYTSGNPTDRALAYINNLRTTYNTDWSYAFIVADSLNDSDGRFEGSQYFAWAYLGGPYSIMTYDNDGYSVNYMHTVATHESGHIFLAADEYCQPGYACCDVGPAGYLYVPNTNCEKNNPSSVDCIMKYNSDAICQYTNGQIGWQDTDSDGKPDTIDNVVTNTLNPHMTPTTETVLTFTGTATDVPCFSPVRPNVTINKISAVKYRIDGGTWTDASASDGSFNEDSEDYTFTTQPLEAGEHLIETQAYSTSGNTSTVAGRDVEIILETGSLRVTISPQCAIDAGAQWRRAGMSTWLDSGYTEHDVAAGSYMVEFKDIPGWLKPANLPVSISENQLTEADAVYTAAITIGTGTTTVQFPLVTSSHDARSQTIYRASEIGGSYTITALALDVNKVPGQTMDNFTIRMKHTGLNAYGSSPEWESSDWITVYQTNETITTTGWVKFDFTTPFEYNGTQNLMVDISFNNDSNSIDDGLCYFSMPGGTRSIFYKTNSGYGDPLDWSGRTPTPTPGPPIWNVELFVVCERMDFYDDGIVNFRDFAIFASYWMDDICSEPDWCEGSDSDYSGRVDFVDLLNFVKYWPEGTED
jgi:hypothetical protein